jgi:multimeric flavodoxin WrbA
MQIAVLNGSPKGEMSGTMQYVRYLQKVFPQHKLKMDHISQRIKRVERDDEVFYQIIDGVRSSDAVLWASPVYYYLVPAQYKRFIELIWERGVGEAFAGKYAASLTTSINFYDYTAHEYLQAISEDLGMRFVGPFSAAMYDLLEEAKRDALHCFAEELFGAVERGAPTARRYPPTRQSAFEYTPGFGEAKVDLAGHRMQIITDAQERDRNLTRMIQRFRGAFSTRVPVVNLHDVDIKGGCQGCLHCGYDNQCVYAHADGFVDFYESQVKPADILILGGTIRDRHLSSRWKLFFDRSFYSGHVPTLGGKQVALLISGSLSQNPHLPQIVQAHLELQPANLAGIITDETGDSGEMDRLLDELAQRIVQYASLGFVRPRTFLAVGGRKLFRDAVWGRMRTVFPADHRTFKRLGWYDFPQKETAVRVQNAVFGALMKSQGFRQEYYKRVKPGMIQPHLEFLAKM